MYLQRPNLYPEASKMIRIGFERTAQDRSRVFSNELIIRILDVPNQFFAYKNIKYAKYTVEREDGKVCTFTDADLIDLCTNDLPHLHDYFSGRIESRRDYAGYLRRVVQVMREQIIFNSQIDFEIELQLGEEKIALTRPHDIHEGIERWVTNFVITRSVLGFQYMDNHVKKVFRIQDAAKY